MYFQNKSMPPNSEMSTTSEKEAEEDALRYVELRNLLYDLDKPIYGSIFDLFIHENRSYEGEKSSDIFPNHFLRMKSIMDYPSEPSLKNLTGQSFCTPPAKANPALQSLGKFTKSNFEKSVAIQIIL